MASGAAALPAELDATQLLELLYRQLRSLAGPRADLDDIVQAAAERVLKSMRRFEGRSSFSTWAYGVAYRTLLDHDRWYARFRRRFTYAEEVKVSEPECSSKLDSEALLLEAQRARRLYRALDRLPSAKRSVLVLHDMEELTAREVAEIVGTNERTVRSRLRDGRAQLAKLLALDTLFQAAGAP
jgi:RNA polymerase sigma-70 factor (ECF subfamily)